MTNRGMAHVHGATKSAEGVPKRPRVSMLQWRRYQRIVSELARYFEKQSVQFRFLFCVASEVHVRGGKEGKKKEKHEDEW